jgi:hypothetical protein
MTPLEIFGTQFVLSLLVYALLSKWYLTPWLAKKPVHVALSFLIIPHATRHIGLSFIVPGLTDSPPTTFATAAAYGDFASGLLAILCLIALRSPWKAALPLVWIFSIVGTADLMNALRQVEVVPYLGVTWFIPTFLVPMLLVTHVMIFARLSRHEPESNCHA